MGKSKNQKLKEDTFLRIVNRIKAGMLEKAALFGAAVLIILPTLLPLGEFARAADDEDQFEDVEIRVIRPRYFNKRKRFELGAQFAGVMNDTFIYTFLGTGVGTYHFSERWALALSGSYGFSMDKRDKEILSAAPLRIMTKILRTQYSADGQIQFTPMYGKWQLTTGRLIYFDTFLIGGVGMSGVEYRYSDYCTKLSDSALNKMDPADRPSEVPADKTVPYPTVVVGLGQRYFMNRTLSYNVSIRNHTIFANRADGSCNTNAPETGGQINHNTMLQIGASKYF